MEKASHVSFVCFSIKMTIDLLCPRNRICELGMHLKKKKSKKKISNPKIGVYAKGGACALIPI